jgi:hypothetical protein
MFSARPGSVFNEVSRAFSHAANTLTALILSTKVVSVRRRETRAVLVARME